MQGLYRPISSAGIGEIARTVEALRQDGQTGEAAPAGSQKKRPGRDHQSDQDCAEHQEPGRMEAPGGLFSHLLAFLFELDFVFTFFLMMLMMLFFMIQDGTSLFGE
jgi:hypothetical protein